MMNLLHGLSVKVQAVSGGTFQFLVVVFHVMVVIYRMARVVSAFRCKGFFFFKKKKKTFTANSDCLARDGECKHYTVPRARCTRNMFSRVAQECFVTQSVALKKHLFVTE